MLANGRLTAGREIRAHPARTSVATSFLKRRTPPGIPAAFAATTCVGLLGPYPCTAFIMSKIGRYIETTMPPTTTPRNTIMTGSIIASKPDTAASTSSS